MKKTVNNLCLLYMIFGVSLVTSNAIAAKLFTTGINFCNSVIVMTVGVIAYPITFLITDIISEVWGKKEANRAVIYGAICQIISTVLIIIARFLPETDVNVQKSYISMLGQNWVFVCASLCAYMASQTYDVFIFHKIRDFYIKKHGSTRGGRWIWNNASTVTSQFIDSIIYVLIAFGLGSLWLFDRNMYGVMISMVLGQWLIKAVIALLDTPIFYLCTRNTEVKK